MMHIYTHHRHSFLFPSIVNSPSSPRSTDDSVGQINSQLWNSHFSTAIQPTQAMFVESMLVLVALGVLFPSLAAGWAGLHGDDWKTRRLAGIPGLFLDGSFVETSVPSFFQTPGVANGLVVTAGGLAVVSDHLGQLACLNTSTSPPAILWTQALENPPTFLASFPALLGDTLFITSGNLRLSAIDVPSGNLVWHVPPSTPRSRHSSLSTLPASLSS
jgi:outer membrane protein assembly factor BamB